MGRKRSTWNRKADPYTMHQDRDLPPVEKYLIGDPSAFAEDVHQDLPDDAALGRNEIGLPNMPASNLNHKDVEEWNSGDAYDNASTFSPEDRDRKETPDVPVEQMNDRKIATPKRSAREVYAALERKAFHCTKIAQALLPGAPQGLIEDQSYELMALPDEFVLATVMRLAADEEEETEDKKDAGKKHGEEEEEDKKEDRKAKAAELMRQAKMLLAGEDDEDDDGDEDDEKEDEKEEEKEGGKKKSSYDYSDAQIEAMLREMMDDEDDAEAEAMMREMMMEEEAGMGHDSMDMDMHSMDMDMHGMGDEDPEIDAMLKDMMNHDSMDMHSGMDMHMHSSTEFDIGMNPMMDVVASDSLAGDETLQNLFNNTIPKEARTEAPVRETAKTAGVQSLGGRVKEAAETEEDYDLSKLWKHDPDTSDMY
jgi:hypothetical protein